MNNATEPDGNYDDLYRQFDTPLMPPASCQQAGASQEAPGRWRLDSTSSSLPKLRHNLQARATRSSIYGVN
jgi:hypothetical protein